MKPRDSQKFLITLAKTTFDSIEGGIRMEINEEIILGNKDNIKNIITSKFKDKLWSDKEVGRKES